MEAAIPALLRSLLGACLMFGIVESSHAQDGFYMAGPADLTAAAGTMIRSEAVGTAPGGGTHYRILYRSRGLEGEPIAVSGMAFVPPGPAPSGGWPVVAWAHPTSGLVSKCAPSLAHFGVDQVQGLKSFLDAGYVVAAADYPGLGTPGPHPFMVGVSEGRAVLDSIRAMQDLTGNSSGRAILWGHSQGGQAVLFAAALAHAEAADLKIMGVAAAAPATELAALMNEDVNTPGGDNLLAMALWSWAKIYDAPIEEVVLPAAMPTIDSLANQCLESIVDVLPRMEDGRDLMRSFLAVDDLTERAPWQGLIARNTAGMLPTNVPVLLIQGTDDDTVRPAVTASYMQRLCKAGSRVSMVMLPDVGHLTTAKDGVPALLDWMSGVTSAAPPQNDCPEEPPQ